MKRLGDDELRDLPTEDLIAIVRQLEREVRLAREAEQDAQAEVRKMRAAAQSRADLDQRSAEAVRSLADEAETWRDKFLTWAKLDDMRADEIGILRDTLRPFLEDGTAEETRRDAISAALIGKSNAGRRPALTDAHCVELARRHAQGQSVRALAKAFGVGRATIDRALARGRSCAPSLSAMQNAGRLDKKMAKLQRETRASAKVWRKRDATR
ncbi:hypothetical protein CEW88_11660 [Alloyangia pacifica]|uniref:Resolvase HTH domain-containing protein n=1 Tax=Alloyangia pacifica TaxID=311180 RepID=A0A2U8HEM4_9RHOB|nr:helix-turn-helix domain-containing protein [Alloyangia pacifica]AWI84284.1 hypothetical protein CEW88_11660 [Alloyangia pacifica]